MHKLTVQKKLVLLKVIRTTLSVQNLACTLYLIKFAKLNPRQILDKLAIAKLNPRQIKKNKIKK